jgi:peptidoglycan/xylan/chitin deacetylase (PgdA/CDA1 family)
MKGALEDALASGGVAAWSRRRCRDRSLILAYHNIVHDDAGDHGDRSLHLSRRRFSEQLDLLVQSCAVVPLDSILHNPGRIGAPRVAITFDDAYRGAVTLGVEELAKRGLPATIFVAPAFIGGRSFWWDALVERGGKHSITREFRELALNHYRGQDQGIRLHAAQYGMREVVPESIAMAATEAELREAAAVPGITLGSHSWSHPDLTALDPAELHNELMLPLHWLRDRFDNFISWLSYPYGRSSPLIEQAAAAAGYRAALRVSGGWLPVKEQARYALPRYNVPAGLSNAGFTLRIAGLFAERAG